VGKNHEVTHYAMSPPPPHIISSLLRPNIFLSAVLSNNLSPRSFPNVTAYRTIKQKMHCKFNVMFFEGSIIQCFSPRVVSVSSVQIFCPAVLFPNIPRLYRYVRTVFKISLLQTKYKFALSYNFKTLFNAKVNTRLLFCKLFIWDIQVSFDVFQLFLRHKLPILESGMLAVVGLMNSACYIAKVIMR
jgi:hypothetical protein